MSAFYPDARRRFDERGELLLSQDVQEPSATPDSPTEFVPDVPISGTITDADIVGPMKQSALDADGFETGRYAAIADGYVAFEGEQHSELLDLARSIQRTQPMRDAVGSDSIVDWIVEWALDRRVGNSNELLTDFFLRRRKAAVGLYRITVPLHEPFIEAPFDLGTTRLRTLTAEDVATWFQVPTGLPTPVQSAAEQQLMKQRRLLQARTGVVVDIEAERRYAEQLAWNKAELAAAIIRVVSKGVFFPRARTNCVPLGYAVSERQQFIVHRNGQMLGWSESLLDPESLGAWRLDRRMIEQDIAYWIEIARVLDSTTPTEFEKDVSRAILLYSRLALTREVSEKLVHLFAALESVLLRSESEPIQSAISERLAFVVGRDANQRAEIARLLKRVYGLRSRFVHHGRDPADNEDLRAVKKLLYFAWTFFFQLVFATREFKTRTEFLDRVEVRKWQ